MRYVLMDVLAEVAELGERLLAEIARPDNSSRSQTTVRMHGRHSA
jgi:hypothetical protein